MAGELEALQKHPAVQHHGTGVLSEELASVSYVMAGLAGKRFLGTGHDQYVQDGVQKFEGMSQRQLAQELLEEILDAQNYLTMLAVKTAAMALTLAGPGGARSCQCDAQAPALP